MPQININEIDQSVFTRVVNDDKVKVLVPCIASFGPVYDPQTDNAMTFTDVQAFEKVFGYTEPEYNPFPYDVSRTYIKQLINRGAAVSVVRVNNGGEEGVDEADFVTTISSQIKDDTTPAKNIALPSALNVLWSLPKEDIDNEFTKITAETNNAPSDWDTDYYAKYYQVVGDINSKHTFELVPQFTLVTDTTQPQGWPTNYYEYKKGAYEPVTTGTTYVANTYYKKPAYEKDKFYTLKNPDKYMFCEQITGLSAKYTGSFGNHLLVTFTPVNSVNANFANQYSIVTVYNADINVEGGNKAYYNALTGAQAPTNWATTYMNYYTRSGDAPAYIYTPVPVSETPPTYSPNEFYNKVVRLEVTKTIKNVHKLEQHIVTTNPNDVNYIETINDEFFQYIKFTFKPSARDEFTVAWSNIGNTTDGTVVYNGFPNIPLKYTTISGVSIYNTNALMINGYDFDFSDDLKKILITGYKTINLNSDGQNKLTTETVNDYVRECYLINDSETDNVPCIVEQIIDSITNCYRNYSDPYIYDFDFITSGGFINETFVVKQLDSATNTWTQVYKWSDTKTDDETPVEKGILSSISNRFDEIIPSDIVSIHAGMLELVKTRKDCIALADVNPGWNPSDLPQYVEYLNESQCTVHSPWCYTADPYNNNALTLMPPSFVFLYTLLSNLINSPDSQKWFPPAGVTRATARVVVKPYYEIGSTLLNAWQNDTLARVNPIMRLKNYGYVIYGQYTSYVAIDQFTHSALESLNVRLVANCVKKQIFNLCLKLAFEPNNSSLWFKFYDGMDKYLLFMKRNDGVYDYRIQMDESTVTTDDINELRCPGKVWINPTRTAEFFDIDFILTEAGVTFNEEGE